MKKILTASLSLLFLNTSFAYMESVNKIDRKEKKALRAITVDGGSVLLFEQFLKKKKKYNGSDDYTMNFNCKKVNNNTKCSLVKYEVLKAERR